MSLNVTLHKDNKVIKHMITDCAYRDHHDFREDLIRLIGREELLVRMYKEIDWPAVLKETNMPFLELITFSDCKGTIDSKTSTKLYNDFIEWHNKITDVDFKIKYSKWLNVFSIGKEPRNKVVFH